MKYFFEIENWQKYFGFIFKQGSNASTTSMHPTPLDESLRMISAPGTLSDHKSRITARCSSLVRTESGTSMLTVLPRHCYWPAKVRSIPQSRKGFLVLHARKISSTDNITSMKVNNCGNSDSPMYSSQQH
jgi:hypothetical protein